MYDSQINERYIYSKNSLLHESNHIQVYEGIDNKTQQSIHIKIIDENAFNLFDNHKIQSEKDDIFKTGIEIRRYQSQLFQQIAGNNYCRFNSPNVIDVLEIQPNLTVIILQGSKFGTLNEYLERNNYLEESDALLVFKQIALGLQELHSQGVVHGSICLENILVEDRSFSLTHLALSGGEFSKVTNVMKEKEVENNYYLAPEILANISANKTMQSDIWALGILFFRLLRGRYFYGGNSRDEIYDSIISHKTIMKSWLDEFDQREGDFPIQISKQCQFFLGKMLAKNPEDRPSIAEVLNNSLLEIVKIIGKQDQTQLSNAKKYGSDLLMNLPSQLENSSNGIYTFFRESRTRNDIDRYMVEDLYFGVMLKPVEVNDGSQNISYYKTLIRIKVVGNFPHQKIDKFLQNIEKFQQMELLDNIGRSEIVRIHEILHLLPSQSNSFGQVIIVQDYCNQGNLNEYFIKRKNTNQQSVYEIDATLIMHRLLNTMTRICSVIEYHGGLHMKNLYLDQGMIKIGEPLIISSLNEAKFQENREIFDYFAPEYKEDIGVYDPRTDLHKVDIWSFGMIFYKMVFGDIPIFDLQQRPIFPQSSHEHVSERVRDVIRLCLIISVPHRAEWPDVITIMQEEQIEQNYDLTIKPLPITNEQLKPEDTLSENVIPYQYKGTNDKYKMKNMLSNVKQNDVSQINNNNNQKKGRFFQKTQQQENKQPENEEIENSTIFKTKNASFYLDKNTQDMSLLGLNGQDTNYLNKNNQEAEYSNKNINEMSPIEKNYEMSYINKDVSELNSYQNSPNVQYLKKYNQGLNYLDQNDPGLNNKNGSITNIDNNENDLQYQNGTLSQIYGQNNNPSMNNQSMLNDSKYGIMDYANKYEQLEDLDPQNGDNFSQYTQNYQQTYFNTENENPIRIKKQRLGMTQDMSNSRSLQRVSKLNLNSIPQEDNYSVSNDGNLYTESKKFRENKQLITQTDQGTIKPQTSTLFNFNKKDQEMTLNLVPSKSTGGEKLRLLKKLIKVLILGILFITVFFRKNIGNSWEAIINRGDMKIVQIQVLNQKQEKQVSNIITQNTEQFMIYDIDFQSMRQQKGCIDNLQFQSFTHEKKIIDVLRSTAFFFWAFLSFVSIIFILVIRIIHIWRLDLLTVYQNYTNGTLKPFNRYLFHCQIATYLEFSFIYYSHYQIFNFFYYCILTPCLGVETIHNGFPILTDSSKLMLSGRMGDYFSKIICTNALFGFIHLLGIIFYIVNPIKNSELFMSYLHAGIRGGCYVFGCWIMCRIGGFLIFQPTFSYDDQSFIATTLGQQEYQSIFGFIPELIEIIIILIDILVELVFYQIGLQYDNNPTFQVSKRKRDLINSQNIQFKRNPILLANQTSKSLQVVSSNQKQSLPNAALSIYSKRSKKIIDN